MIEIHRAFEEKAGDNTKQLLEDGQDVALEMGHVLFDPAHVAVVLLWPGRRYPFTHKLEEKGYTFEQLVPHLSRCFPSVDGDIPVQHFTTETVKMLEYAVSYAVQRGPTHKINTYDLGLAIVKSGSMPLARYQRLLARAS